MLINNKSIGNFGCSLVKYEVNETKNEAKAEWVKGSLSPSLSFENYKFKNLKITLLLQGANREQVETYKSNLARELRKAEIKFADSRFYFDGVLSSATYKNINRLALEVEINFDCLQQEGLKEINLAKNATQTINILGNRKVEAIIEVTAPSATVAEFVINDIKIKNIAGGQTVVIDGVKKTITMNGKNKFADAELWEFPVFEAGANEIKMNITTVTVKVKYKPTWA